MYSPEIQRPAAAGAARGVSTGQGAQRFPRFASWAAALGCALACTHPIPPRGPLALSPALAREEAVLEVRARTLVEVLEKKGLVRERGALEAYLCSVLRRVAGDALAADSLELDVRVLRNPEPSAMAFANGTILVHTGLLSLLRDEAQLAAILAHEAAHLHYRHALEGSRTARRQRVIGAMLGGALTLAAAGTTGAVLPDLANLGDDYALLTTLRYGRAQERQADADALRLLSAAGYRLQALPEVFALLRDASGAEQPSWLSSHPAIDERLSDAHAQIAGIAPRPLPSGMRTAERYAELAAAVLTENAAMDLELRNFERARRALRRLLDTHPDDPRALFLLAESQRLEHPDGPGIDALIAAYRRAIAADPSYSPPHAELGLLYRRLGQNEQALERIGRYIELAPQTPQAAILAGYARALTATEPLPSPQQRPAERTP